MALIVVCPGRCISLTGHEEVRFRLIVNKVKANLPRRHEARSLPRFDFAAARLEYSTRLPAHH